MASIHEKVRLTDAQMEDICNSIPVNRCLPEHIKHSVISKIRTRLYNDLHRVTLYPHLYEKFKQEIVRYYYKTLVASGEAVGVQVAQSIGERQTQTTLNTFHSSGLSIKTVVVGVPRFSELLNATKSPKMVNCLLYLTESFDDISQVRRRVGNMFTDITLKRLTKSTELIKDEPLEDWHHLFCDIYEINPAMLGWRLRFYIDRDMLYEYKVTMKMIAHAIMNEYKDTIAIYTPEWHGIIDVFVDEASLTKLGSTVSEESDEVEEEVVEDEDNDVEDDDVNELDDEEKDDEDEKEDDNGNTQKCTESLKIHYKKREYKDEVIPDDIDRVIHMEDKVLPALLGIRICGLENIKDIFFEKRKNEWIITTEGSNLYELFCNPLIDCTRSMSNDMWEIYNIFGIEAVRQFLIEEYMDIVSSDGTFVNISNIELLVDIMVYTGTIISISRYGQKKVGCGPIAKATFEESLENFLKAGINGETENADGVSASIMLGKMPNIGTGVFDLMVDVNRLLENQPYYTKYRDPVETKNETVRIESPTSHKSNLTKVTEKPKQYVKKPIKQIVEHSEPLQPPITIDQEKKETKISFMRNKF